MYPVEAERATLSQCVGESILDRLKNDKAYTEKKLASLNEAIETLEKNPDLVKVVNTLQGLY